MKMSWRPARTRVTNIGTAIQENQMSIAQRVFSQSSAAYLGVAMPSVGVGTVTYPRITAGTDGDVRSPTKALDGTAATISSESINPVRLTASYTYTLESLQLIQGFESALRNDLRAVLADKADSLAINGQAASGANSPKIDGLLNTLTNPTDPTAVALWTDYLSAYDDAVDGKYANTAGAVRLLVNAATFRHANLIVIGTNTGTLLRDRLSQDRFRVSGNMPDTVSTIAKAIRYASGASSVARGVIMPVWKGIQVINDMYTQSAKGEVHLTFVQMVGWKVVDSICIFNNRVQTSIMDTIEYLDYELGTLEIRQRGRVSRRFLPVQPDGNPERPRTITQGANQGQCL